MAQMMDGYGGPKAAAAARIAAQKTAAAKKAAIGKQATAALPPYASAGQAGPAVDAARKAAIGRQAISALPPYASPGQLPPDKAAFLSDQLPDVYGDNANPIQAPVYTPPPTRTSGSGRQTSDLADGGMAGPPAVYAPPAQMTAPPAVVQPPAITAAANPSATNVAGESFTTVGNPGTFGGYERRRQSRGPRTGLSVTPEMIRSAAAQRLG